VTSSKVKAGSKLFPTDPVAATEGAVSSWFSLAHPSSVITGSGYSNVHDILNPSSPITQTTDARRPPNATSNNGLPIITNAAGFLNVPVISARTNQTTWGFWGWFKQSTTADNAQSFTTASSTGCNVNRSHVFFLTSGTALRFRVFATDATSRDNTISSLTAAQWNFFTVEFNGNRSADARSIVTVNATIPSQTYASVTGVTEIPATLRAVTGNGSTVGLGSGGPFFVGSVGTNFGFFGGAMSAASEGLLTQQARLALMNYQRPT
jgi:hypothetical protein